MTELSIEQRVANGAAWLDAHEPGWVYRVSLPYLDITQPCQCVLGQLFGSFRAAPADVRFEGGDFIGGNYVAPENGFDVGDVLTVDEADAEADALRDEWARVITSRRGAVSDAR